MTPDQLAEALSAEFVREVDRRTAAEGMPWGDSGRIARLLSARFRGLAASYEIEAEMQARTEKCGGTLTGLA